MIETETLGRVIADHFAGFSVPIFIFVAVAGSVLFYLIEEIIHSKARRKWTWYIPFVLLIVYVSFMLQMTMFNREIGSRGTITTEIVNIFSGQLTKTQLYLNLLNIVLFMPYGFLVGIIRKRDKFLILFLLSVMISFIGSFAIEIIQLITKCGYFETMDLLTNTIGGILGAIVGWFVARPVKR